MARVEVRMHRGRKAFARDAVVLEEMTAVHEQQLKPEFLQRFNAVVANWKHRPDFRARKVLGAEAYRLYVYPAGSEEAKQIWRWNVEGTRAHPIAARNAPYLRFKWNGPGSYAAKTGPGGKWYGGPGRVIGGRWYALPEVHHPGTAPRAWPTVIGKQLQHFYARTIENAWRRALRRINQG